MTKITLGDGFYLIGTGNDKLTGHNGITITRFVDEHNIGERPTPEELDKSSNPDVFIIIKNTESATVLLDCVVGILRSLHGMDE